MAPPTQPQVVDAPSAPLGAADHTRRFALRRSDGRTRFPGLTRGEGAAAIAGLAHAGPSEWDDALVEVSLPVVITDGAGPYLLAADGSLVLVLGEHPLVTGVKIAMGQPNPEHLIGAVERWEQGSGWRWLACASVAADGAVEALDALAAADRGGLASWSGRPSHG